MRNPFKTYRINIVFFLSFSILITILFGLTIWMNYSSSSSEIARITSVSQQRVLGELNKKLALSLVSVEQTSSAIARNLDVLYGKLTEGGIYEQIRVQSEIRQQLNNIVYGTPLLQSIGVYSDYAFWQDYQSPVTYHPLSKASQESWYSSIRDSDTAWIGEHQILSNNGPINVISFARKVYNNSGRYYALMVFHMKASSVQALIAPEEDIPSMALLDSTGQMMTQYGSDIPTIRMEELKLKMEANTGYFHLGDEFVIWSRSLDSRWILVEVNSWEEMTRASLRMTRIYLLLGIGAIGVVFVITILISRQFMQPIGLLLQAMGSYSPAHADDQPLPGDYTNEFGRLFRGYRSLTTRIDELYLTLEDQHKRERLAEIKSLQMMINPHFLYNTLDQINWTAIESGQNKISSMLHHLAQMFRYALSNTNSLATVHEEINHIDSYLKFQQIRWEDRLTCRVTVDPETTDLLVPKIMLQPFIENSFMHGFNGVEYPELMVHVAIGPPDEPCQLLLIHIEDNGNGLHPNWQTRERQGSGHGLRNVKERIRAIFGSEYGFELTNRPESGTRVTIRLPIRKQSEE
jgi:two-component system, sensor histidine kinase YesM